MLQSDCCNNYLCHYCAGDLYEREELVPGYIARCLFNCETEKFILKDVPKDARLKKYTDSQMCSVYDKANGEQNAFKAFRSSGGTAFMFSNGFVSEKGRHTWNVPDPKENFRNENRSPMAIIQNDPRHLLGED